MTPTPETVVRAFFDHRARPGNVVEAIDLYVAESCVWTNTGMPTAEGKAAIKGFMQQFVDALGMQGIKSDFRQFAIDGDAVLIDRIDQLLDADGREIMSMEISSTFIVEDGRIVLWRNYFDPTPFTASPA
jgi:limonene-1,2-epoxide hydrolase